MSFGYLCLFTQTTHCSRPCRKPQSNAPLCLFFAHLHSRTISTLVLLPLCPCSPFASLLPFPDLQQEIPYEQQPIIAALTADVGPGIEAECREAGMSCYLSKPVDKTKLQWLVTRCKEWKAEGSPRCGLEWFN